MTLSLLAATSSLGHLKVVDDTLALIFIPDGSGLDTYARTVLDRIKKLQLSTDIVAPESTLLINTCRASSPDQFLVDMAIKHDASLDAATAYRTYFTLQDVSVQNSRICIAGTKGNKLLAAEINEALTYDGLDQMITDMATSVTLLRLRSDAPDEVRTTFNEGIRRHCPPTPSAFVPVWVGTRGEYQRYATTGQQERGGGGKLISVLGGLGMAIIAGVLSNEVNGSSSLKRMLDLPHGSSSSGIFKPWK